MLARSGQLYMLLSFEKTAVLYACLLARLVHLSSGSWPVGLRSVARATSVSPLVLSWRMKEIGRLRRLRLRLLGRTKVVSSHGNFRPARIKVVQLCVVS